MSPSFCPTHVEDGKHIFIDYPRAMEFWGETPFQTNGDNSEFKAWLMENSTCSEPSNHPSSVVLHHTMFYVLLLLMENMDHTKRVDFSERKQTHQGLDRSNSLACHQILLLPTS